VKTKIVSVVLPAKEAGESDLRGRIVNAAGKLFLKRGFFGVTSDDIAAELGISKATLYRCFKSKEGILVTFVDSLRTEAITEIEAIVGDETSAFFEKIARLALRVSRMFPLLNSVLAEDIKRSLPDVWKDIEDFRRQKIMINFRILVDEGIRKGVFRGDVDRDLIVEMYLTLIEKFLDPDTLLRKNKTAGEVFKSIIAVFFSGIFVRKVQDEFPVNNEIFPVDPQRADSGRESRQR
jgi:AcrR family transcriptional regulator